MKKYIINCILALILLFGLTKFFISERDNQRSQLDYDQAVQIAGAQHMDQDSQTEPAEEAPIPHNKRGKISEKTLDSGTVK